MPLFPFADDRAALQFEDLASLLDAGLLPSELGKGGAHGDDVLQALLAERGVKLTRSEDAMLDAAWRAGRAGAALRERANVRRLRAAFTRTVWAGLSYPIVLLTLVLVSTALSAAVTNNATPSLVALLVVAALGAGTLLVASGVRRGGPGWLRAPMLGPLASDLGEIPYLETLHGLYAAGVPLLEAHARAVATCPIAAVRGRLEAADRVLRTNRPLGEALAQANALGAESRQMLATGERAGDLEGALRRALQRRSEVSSRNAARLAKTVGLVAFAIAAAVVIVTVFSFYSGLYGKLGAFKR